MGGGVPDPDLALHLARLPAALLGPRQPRPQPRRDAEGCLPRHDAPRHARRLGDQVRAARIWIFPNSHQIFLVREENIFIYFLLGAGSLTAAWRG